MSLDSQLAILSDNTVQAIRWFNDELQLLDQRVLPHQIEYLSLFNAKETATAITDMVVRGAPAIGITAAYGIATAARNNENLDHAYQVLAASRPTAVNLFWALERMRHVQPQTFSALLAEAKTIHQEDIQANIRLGQLGAGLMAADSQIYTHCNAGALATGGYGTALGVIRAAFADDKLTQVYAGETRPWLQGSRLTAWELMQDNIPVKLCAEGAAAQLFRQGNIDWLVVGADRIAANGDVANKVGTYGLALLAKHHGIKVMIAAPTSTIDMQTSAGAEINIEQRHSSEMTHHKGQAIAPEGCEAINPAFDITPAELIDVIATEKGLILQPSNETVAMVMSR
ncbi:S-methyl-5-thioribose-1-phosphate isomerase [Oleispira antarctica]|uniref:Methylthioribose-1-phosphate isomerase n=1 Tax=Oleispira antarctica TaxID=188908 RepID=A0A1Y5HRN0_OLEAN|nr:S-methyl-5-thioribose-1-phosphate isomerase [Oleispira antarctica]